MKFNRRQRACLATVIVFALAFTLWHAVPAIRVGVHRQQMQMQMQMQYWASRQRGVDSETVQGVVKFRLFNPSTQYEYHRQQLVKLGAMTQRNYTFKSFAIGSKSWFAFFATVEKSELPSDDWEGPNRFRRSHFSVWCDKDDAPAWDNLVDSHEHTAQLAPQ